MPALATARIALGFLIAPLAGVLVLSASICLSGPHALVRVAGCVGEMFPFLAWLGLFCAYPPTLLLGVPLFFVLKRNNQLRPLPLALAGLVFGVAASVLFFVIDKKFSVWSVPFALRAGVGWAGPIAGLVFWGVAVFRNTALTRASTRPG